MHRLVPRTFPTRQRKCSSERAARPPGRRRAETNLWFEALNLGTNRARDDWAVGGRPQRSAVRPLHWSLRVVPATMPLESPGGASGSTWLQSDTSVDADAVPRGAQCLPRSGECPGTQMSRCLLGGGAVLWQPSSSSPSRFLIGWGLLCAIWVPPFPRGRAAPLLYPGGERGLTGKPSASKGAAPSAKWARSVQTWRSRGAPSSDARHGSPPQTVSRRMHPAVPASSDPGDRTLASRGSIAAAARHTGRAMPHDPRIPSDGCPDAGPRGRRHGLRRGLRRWPRGTVARGELGRPTKGITGPQSPAILAVPEHPTGRGPGTVPNRFSRGD